MLCFKNYEKCQFPLLDEKNNTIFVLMPLAKEFDDIYFKGIKGGLPPVWECNRSDERWDIPEAVCKICKSIQEATLIIADITGRNANVFLELGLSFGLEKKFILITQNINDLPFDVKTFNTIEYNPDNLDDLRIKLREAINQLKPMPRMSKKTLVFDKNREKARELLDYQAPHPEQFGPTMQVFVGSKNNNRDWLPPSEENRNLLQCAPNFLFREIKARHDYYDFQPRYENHFLRILRNGFIISKFPTAQWDSHKEMSMRTIYIHELIGNVAELFLFACRIMKKREIRDGQRMVVELLNAKGYPIRFDTSPGSHRDYDFADYSLVLEEDFNPDNDWKILFGTLVRIYRLFCKHAAITDITDETIWRNLRRILGQIRELHTTYSDSGVTSLDLNEIFEDF